MFDELVSFYARSGILSTSFSCQHPRERTLLQ
jgi:hypothetical protein